MSSVVIKLPNATAPVFNASDRAAEKGARTHGASGTLSSLIFRFSPARHALVTGLALASTPILYLSLEIPKWVVNGALGNDADALPEVLQGLTPHAALVALCAGQLAALGILSGLKFMTNVLSANLGERFLRHLRLDAFRQMRDGGLARNGGTTPVLTQELEAIAGFAGGAVSVPVGQIAAFVTVMSFLVVQDWRLALAALALTPVQVFMVPYLLRRVSALKRARIGVVREMCAKVTDGGRLSGALLDARRAQDLRFDIHRRKFAMKAGYNLIGHMTPLSYMSVGGWLVLSGDLSLGALVAAISAYREGAGPMRELFNFYVRWADARTRYAAVQARKGQVAVAKMAA